MNYSEMIANSANFKWPNLSGALARQTKKGTIITATIKEFQQGTSELTQENIYCLTEEGYRFRFPEDVKNKMKEGAKVTIRKEESEINGSIVHFFQFQEVQAAAAVTRTNKKAGATA